MINALLILAVLFAPDERSLFLAGSEALKRGDLDAARQSFESILQANPNHLPALGNLGVVYSQQGDFERAAGIYLRAIKLAPADPRLRLNLGLAYLKENRCGDALPEFDWLIKNGHSSERNIELYATCQIAVGRVAEGLSRLERLPLTASVLYQRGLAHSRLGHAEQAHEIFKKLMEAEIPAAQRHFLLGRAAYESGAFEEAVAELTLAQGVEGVERELGKALLSLRRNEDAEAALRAALVANGRDVEAEYFLAGVLLQASRTEEALPILRRVAEKRPDFWGAHYYLGRALLQKGEATAAIAELEWAGRAKPEEPAIQYQLSRAYVAAGKPAEARLARERYEALRQSEHSGDADLLRRGALPGRTP